MMQKPTWKSTLKSFLYLAPALIFIGIFNIYPIFKSLAMSFYENYNIFTGEVGSYGLSNFKEIFSDPSFYTAIRNTFIFVLGVVPASIIISLFVAMMLNRINILSSFFRSIYFLPFVTSTVAVSIVWNWLYHTRYGLINYFLSFVGVEPMAWLTNPKFALPALIIMSIWKGLGYNIILFLVGLNNIDKNYYRAARVDGASNWQQFVNITMPLLNPYILLVSIIGVINSFKVFTEVYSLFSGRPGPAGSALTMVFYIYEKFYTEYQYGVATAAGIVLFLIILVFTLLQRLVSKRFIYN